MKAFLSVAMAAAFLLFVNAETRAATCSQMCNKKCEHGSAWCNTGCSTWCVNHGYR